MVRYVRKLIMFDSPGKLEWAIYFCFFAVLHIPGVINFYHNSGENNAYLLFSESLLKGNITLPAMDNYHDMIEYNGKYYLPYPPLPSVLLAPLVAIWGVKVNTVLIALLFSCLNIFIFYKILIRLKVDQSVFPWLITGTFFGTGYWFVLFTSHHVYSFAHLVSFSLQLLVINEILGKRRWAIVGLLIGCSFLTRQFTFIYIIYALGYMLWVHYKGEQKIKAKQVMALCGTLGLFVFIYLLYNYIRFDNPFDAGYSHIVYNGVLKNRIAAHGVFSADYFLFNFYSLFIKGFNIEFEGSGLMNIKDVDLWGTSLLAASPFVIASVKAGLPRIVSIAMWVTIFLIITGTLFYHNNGYQQVNTMRFTMDFLPLLMILTALGLRHTPTWIYKSLITYAVILNLLSFWIHYKYQ